MSKDNARIYGPPSHSLDYLSVQVHRFQDRWIVARVSGGSLTSKGALWALDDVYESDTPAHAHEQVAIALHALTSDLLRDKPSTQERAQFVASGGLYEQLNMF